MKKKFFHFAAFSIVIIIIILIDCSIPFLPQFQRLDYIAPNLMYTHPIYGTMGSPNAKGWFERQDFINYVELNNYGYHDYDVLPKKKKRIVTLGGSFTFGGEVPIPNTWPKVFEKLLQNRFEVVNLAFPSKKFNHYFQYLDDSFFSEFQPNAIIFGFSYGRLSPDVTYGPLETSCQRAGNYRGFSYLYGSKGDIRAKLAIKLLISYFPLSIYEKFPILRKSNIIQFLIKFQEQRFINDYPEYKNIRLSGNQFLDLYCNKEASIDNTRKHINAIKKICRKYDVPVSFFFIPEKDCYLDVNGRDAGDRIPTYFSKDDNVIDLGGDFKKDYEKRKVLLHWENDAHPNAEGYELIGRLIYKYFSTESVKEDNIKGSP
jgi:hypothetical protein